MLITEMIKQLEELKEKYGDLPCGAVDEDGGAFPVNRVTYEDYEACGMDEKPFILIR